MKLHIVNEPSKSNRSYVVQQMIQFNSLHFPKELRDNYQEVHLMVKDEDGQLYGGLIGEIFCNWMQVEFLFVDEKLRGQHYGSQLLEEAEKLAKAKRCDFIKLDTLSFQALDFYLKNGFVVYGKLENAGGHTHYYLKKDI